ncbi:MAG TPA: coniferyl-alcohol dehydrogenase [Acidimicrobiia bacterium]|nr:coniferyl-alcohol dehydrogenase [Acidimicrobiia bacterium]
MFRYDGQRVVITGASSGMGAATASMLTEAGAEVHALDVREVTVPGVKAYETDVGNPASVDAALDAIGAPVHKLFNVAGVPQTHPPERVFAVNFLGLRYLTERVLPLMPSGGAVASVASLAGMGWKEHLPTINEVLDLPDFEAGVAWTAEHLDAQGDPYFFSKECVIVLTFRLAARLARDPGIRVNCVSPGPVDSPMMADFRAATSSAAIDWTASQANGRLARPDEMAPPLVFLNSDEASYVSGVNLLADAGFSAAMTTGQVDFSSLPSR